MVLMPPMPGPLTHMTEASHDPAANLIWIGSANPAAGAPTIGSVNPATLVAGPMLVVDELDAGGGSPAGPDVDGPVDGISVTMGGTLLCADRGGDGVRFSDTLFEVGTVAPTLLNFWYLNGRACASCRPNTNIDVPQRDLFAVGAISASRGLAMPGTDVFVARGATDRGTTTLARIELLPGQPGAWRLLQDVPSPTGVAPTGIAFDPSQAMQNGVPNVYWFVAGGNHNLFECTWDPATQRFLMNQSVPTPLESAMTANRIDSFVAPRLGTAGPHELVVGEFGLAAATSLLAKIRAGTGAPDVPVEEGPIYHSTLTNAVATPTDPAILFNEVQLWQAGSSSPSSQWTMEQAAAYVFGAALWTTNRVWDVDALALDPAFPRGDPTFFDMYWSDREDQPMAVGGGYLNGDVIRYRRDGTKDVLIDEATIRSVLGLGALTAINTDALAILSNGDLLLSFSDTSLATTDPSFGGNPILDGDVVVIPASRTADSGYWAYREAEWAAFIANALGTPSFTYSELDGLEVDPNGSAFRQNPHQAGFQRPDVLFTVDYTTTVGVPPGSRRNHVFSTRVNGAGSGAISKDARTMGYGAWNPPPEGLLVDALAVPARPIANGPPTADAFAQLNLAPAGTQIVRLIGRNLPLNDPAVLFFIDLAPLVPTADLHPTIIYNPLMALPAIVFPAVADARGLVEVRFDLPAPIGVTFAVQIGTVTASALGTVTRLTLL
jgi:hypothetical protein